MDDVTTENDEIISIIRKINPNKATGSDGISGQMLLICDESVIIPLQIIFTNILSTFVTPILKKGDKQLIKIIDQSSSPYLWKDSRKDYFQ